MKYVNTRQRFPFSCFRLGQSHLGLTPEKFAHIGQIKRGRIVAMKFETARILVLRDAFTALTVVVA